MESEKLIKNPLQQLQEHVNSFNKYIESLDPEQLKALGEGLHMKKPLNKETVYNMVGNLADFATNPFSFLKGINVTNIVEEGAKESTVTPEAMKEMFTTVAKEFDLEQFLDKSGNISKDAISTLKLAGSISKYKVPLAVIGGIGLANMLTSNNR